MVHVFFVCRPQPGDLIELLNEEFSVLILLKIQSSIEDSCNLVGKVIDNDYSIGWVVLKEQMLTILLKQLFNQAFQLSIG